jgi:predicted PurR-regulated permease PerM
MINFQVIMPEPIAQQKPQLITVSTVTILKVVIVVLSLAFIYLIRDIVALFFVSLVLASIINPLAAWFQARKLQRGMAVIMLYLLIMGIFALILVSLVPAVTAETRELVRNADAIWSGFLDSLGPLRGYVASQGLSQHLSEYLSGTSGAVGAAAGGLVTTIKGFFSGLMSAIIVFVVTFYLVISEDAMKRLFREVAPEAYQPYLTDLFSRIEAAIGSWVRGQLILSAIIAVVVYLMLNILGVKYALVLALIAGVAESIPYIGPVMSAIPAVLIALTMSPVKGLLTLIMYIVIQQVENHVLVPKVMQKATGLHPIVSIFSLLIGAKVAGIVGALLAIPLATALSIVITDSFQMIKTHK